MLAHWQSRQDACAAANADKSIGVLGQLGPSMAGGNEDPEGLFTSVDLGTTTPGQLQTVACPLEGGGAGGESVLTGRERVSATMLDSPVMWQIAGVNSVTKERSARYQFLNTTFFAGNGCHYS